MSILKRIASLIWQGAPRNQYYLEVGTYLLKKGTGYQVGQVVDKRKVCGKERPVYIDNLFYDFKHNRVNHTLSDKPVPQTEKED